jgi:hypothetical protein
MLLSNGFSSSLAFDTNCFLPMSMNRPNIDTHFHVDWNISSDSEFSTTSTPLPSVARRRESAKLGDRLEKMWSSGMPYTSMRRAFFSGVPTVQYISAPR